MTNQLKFNGQRFKKLRKKFGLTQEEMAMKCNKNTSYISRLESNSFIDIKVDFLIACSKVFDMPIHHVITEFFRHVPETDFRASQEMPTKEQSLEALQKMFAATQDKCFVEYHTLKHFIDEA